MMRLNNEIIHFFNSQGFVIASTVDRDGKVHTSCKGIVKINLKGEVYLLDLYKNRTYENLKNNPHISITAVDEHKFSGYCLKGKAKIIVEDDIKPNILNSWEERITGRLSRRILKNIRNEKGHPSHPEARLPKPKYLIVMQVQDVVDLTPQHIK